MHIRWLCDDNRQFSSAMHFPVIYHYAANAAASLIVISHLSAVYFDVFSEHILLAIYSSLVTYRCSSESYLGLY